FCKSVRVLQHKQPLPSSVTSSLLSRSRASSMPSHPNSLTISAVPFPSGESRKRRTSVVFPAPRNPVTIVTGSRDPRSRFCRRPKRPASADGKRSKMVLVITCHALSSPSPGGGGSARGARRGGVIFAASFVLQRHRLCISCSIERGVDCLH